MGAQPDFVERLTKMAEPVPEFPQLMYDPDGDCLEFLTSGDTFRAERIDRLVTVYYSQDTGEIIGSLIKGLRRRLDDIMRHQLPGFGIEIQDGRVRLSHLFRVLYWSAKWPAKARGADDLRVMRYQKLIEMAEETKVEAEVCVA